MVGRGPGGGSRTCGRGSKGRKARGTVPLWYEGGQTPFFLRLKKFGKVNPLKKNFDVISLGRIARFLETGRLKLEEGEVLNPRKMLQCGLVSGSTPEAVKIICEKGDRFNTPIKIEASRATHNAIKRIEQVGGEFTARYYTKLSMKVHCHPQVFLRAHGRLPLPPRPSRRKDIEYYGDIKNRGYLVKENHPMLKAIEEAKANPTVRTKVKKSALDLLLEKCQKNSASSSENKQQSLESAQKISSPTGGKFTLSQLSL